MSAPAKSVILLLFDAFLSNCLPINQEFGSIDNVNNSKQSDESTFGLNAMEGNISLWFKSFTRKTFLTTNITDWKALLEELSYNNNGTFVTFSNATANDEYFDDVPTNLQEAEVIFHSEETIAIISSNPLANRPHCDLRDIGQKKKQKSFLRQLSLANKTVEQIGFPLMLNLLRICKSLEDEGSSDTEVKIGFLSSLSYLKSGVYPGTKWCGLGDIAKNYADLGPLHRVDRCCRSHDLCPRKVFAFRSSYGLFNWSIYTRSHCECDATFNNCLKRVGSLIADRVGKLFFNLLNVKCLEETPAPICLRYDGASCITWDGERNATRFVFRRNAYSYR